MFEIPIYQATIDEENEGVYAISLVENPAIQSNFVAFKQEQKFSIQENRIVTGAIMIPDYPIYRRDKNGEYYLTFSKDVIKTMVEKMLANGTFKYIDAEHNDKMIEGVNLLEVYLTDSSKGIKPSFLDVPDGSLIVSFKVRNDSVWESIKSGDFKGFSLSGLFNVEREDSVEDVEDVLDDILNQLKKLRKIK